MNEQLEFFRKEFLQDVFGVAETQETFLESSFIEKYGKELEESGEVDDEIQLSHWSQRGLKVDAYCYNENEGTLNLFISIFSENLEDRSLTKSSVDQAFSRIKNFFAQAYSKNYYTALEESTSVYDLAYTIYKNKNNISNVKYYILSNKILNDNVDAIHPFHDDNVDFSFHIWDISRLFRMDSSSQKKEDIFVNFDELSADPIYCLPAHLNTDEYKSYLLVVPGTLLSNLYGQYGARLLEQNVRTFLQARGKVNKGLRTTILNYPQKFFAYNNGLTTTAENIEVEATQYGMRIKSLKNLQIVNGGQTTASIYSALKKDKAKLDHIFVQMKLTIVNSQEADELVPKISEYANTQNKVNAADFFSNHPFHVRMQDFSRRIYAPAADGGHKQTKWFYERARGQYLDAQAHKTQAERKRFQLEYPKKQVFTKTDLSKFENVWESIPHIVAQGAQNSFVKYASDIGKKWEKNDTEYNELYYKSAIAKAIVFKTTEKLVSDAHWYDGGYRAQIVAYTIAVLNHEIQNCNRFFDFLSVWNRQATSKTTNETLKVVSKAVYDKLTNPPPGIANISQWAKKEGCWQNMQTLSIVLSEDFLKELIGKEEYKEEKKVAKKVQYIDNGIEAQKLVFSISDQGRWNDIKKFGIENKMLTQQEIELIDLACAIPNKIPTEKQAIKIINAYYNLEEIGLTIK